jgi:hypothetical protein
MSRQRHGQLVRDLSALSADDCLRVVRALSARSHKRLKRWWFGRGQLVRGHPIFPLGRRRQGCVCVNTHPCPSRVVREIGLACGREGSR